MATKMTEAFKSEFAAGLARKNLPPNEHFMLMCEMLHKHKMCYKLLAHPRLFMTHYKNKGGACCCLRTTPTKMRLKSKELALTWNC
jgi:hypothetical protein